MSDQWLEVAAKELGYISLAEILEKYSKEAADAAEIPEQGQ